VRFAPSPTGLFHAGAARTLLFNWLFARRHGGKFILRIEDTDRTRFHEDALQDMLDSLRWLGLDWDEGPEVGGPYAPYFQSQRLPIYQEYAQKLLASGAAYKCYCSVERLAQLREGQKRRGQASGYDRTCRTLTAREQAEKEAQGIVPTIRLKVPLAGETAFEDYLRGRITVQNSQMEDIVLMKSDGFPTYHLAHLVDDHIMQISHVMRAEEWIPSTAYHVLIYQAFGWTPPIFVHLPDILNPDGKGKMSKRKTVTPDGREHFVRIREFRDAGYLPEAMFNMLALTGWAYDDKSDILTREQIISRFDLEHISKSGARFNYDKLDWMNGQYIRMLDVNDLAERMRPFLYRAGMQADLDTLRRVAPLIQERMVRLSDVVELTRFLFVDELHYDPRLLMQKGMTYDQAQQVLAESYRVLSAAPAFDEATIEALLRAKADQLGLKNRQFLGTLRVATTGREVSPPLFGTLAILGRERVLVRIARAQEMLAGVDAQGCGSATAWTRSGEHD
jgi:glutamyl-tRNA synthetase